MRNILSFISVLICLNASAQSYNITASIKNLPEDKIILTRIRGDHLYTVDSLHSTSSGIQFTIPQNFPSGLYRLILGENQRTESIRESFPRIDLIFNKENIAIKSDFNFLFDSLKIIESEENKIYYSFLREYEQLEYRKHQVYPLLNNYPKETKFYKQIISEFHKVQHEQSQLIERMCTKHPNTYAAKLIEMHKTPFLEGDRTEMDRVIHMREHFFDDLDFTDTLLINSNIYTQKIISYLSLYRNPNMTQSDQEDLFIEAVDHILSNTNMDPKVFDFVLEYLIDGFEQFKFEKVLTHIADNYLDESCETEDEILLRKRLEAYQRMAVGKTAPNIIIEDIEGNMKALSELAHHYILVLFWASDCPHCNNMIPKLKEWYVEDREIDMEIFAISIDENLSDAKTIIYKNQLPWINCYEPGGWKGKAASDYNLYATPTMLILDHNRKILSKPITFSEFKRDVNKLVK
jgi:thiol-disulfide isomerase/thioredoxin